MVTRRRFTADFKARVALEALRGDKTIENGGDKLVHGSGGISQPRAE